MVGTTKILAALCCLLVLSVGSTTVAGILDDHPLAYNDGFGPGTDGRWAGTGAYNNGDGTLVGNLDFAVFTANAFNAAFPGASYSPNSGELVYAYQVLNGSGSAAVTLEAVSASPADNIGNFELEGGDIEPSFEQFSLGTAEWYFQDPAIPGGGMSNGLVFSSPNRPVFGPSVTVDGGVFAFVDVPTPGDMAIPEPAAVMLLAIASGAMMMLRRWRG